jgi:nucleotide-binding universal stress UspA family protein
MDSPIRGSRILVPLDGSELAERALIPATRIARGTSSTLVLARVLSPTRLPPDLLANPMLAEAYSGYLDREQHDAAEYVERTASRMREQGIAVETVVRRGTPAAALLELEAERHVRLVLMMTHARWNGP